jgi:Protein of unknown function (DUF3309)
MLTNVLLAILVLALIASIPGIWPHSKDWGKGPITAIFILLMLVLVIALTG